MTTETPPLEAPEVDREEPVRLPPIPAGRARIRDERTATRLGIDRRAARPSREV